MTANTILIIVFCVAFFISIVAVSKSIRNFFSGVADVISDFFLIKLILSLFGFDD